MQIMNVAVYARISTRDKGQDAECQLLQMRKWARDNGHTVVAEYVDNVSGSGKVKRPGFERMMAEAAKDCDMCDGGFHYGPITGPDANYDAAMEKINSGKCPIVYADRRPCAACNGSGRAWTMLLFWSLDRLSREGVMATLQHLQRLDAAGVCYRSHTEPYLDSCGIFKDAVLAILAVVAKQERLRISERVKSGLDKARSEGRVGGRPRVVVDDERMARARELRDMGMSFMDIAGETGFAKSTVHRILMADGGGAA